MHHVCKPKMMLTGLLAVALAALFVQAAAAHQVSQNDNTFAAATVSNSSTTAKAPLVIPYLSHGVGVDTSLYSGTSAGSSKSPLVIPYLSHGVGVDTSLYSGTAQAPDAFERAVNRQEAVVNDMNATSATSGPDAFQRAVNRHDASNGYYDVVRGVFVPAHEATSATAATSGPDAFQRAVNRHDASNGYYDVVRGVFVPAHEATSATAATSGPDAFQRAVNRHDASSGYYDVVRGVFVPALASTSVTSQSPAAVGGQKPYVQGSAGRGSQFALTAPVSPTAVRPDDRAGIRGITASDIASQPQSAAVRPDDRSGLRGIGPFQATKSTASTSSGTNWNTVLAFGGILLGIVLILAVAVGLTRRQHARVLAH